MQLPAPLFFSRANRLAAYKGVMRLVVEAEASQSSSSSHADRHGLEPLPKREEVPEAALFAQLGPGWVEVNSE